VPGKGGSASAGCDRHVTDLSLITSATGASTYFVLPHWALERVMALM